MILIQSGMMSDLKWSLCVLCFSLNLWVGLSSSGHNLCMWWCQEKRLMFRLSGALPCFEALVERHEINHVLSIVQTNLSRLYLCKEYRTQMWCVPICINRKRSGQVLKNLNLSALRKRIRSGLKKFQGRERRGIWPIIMEFTEFDPCEHMPV